MNPPCLPRVARHGLSHIQRVAALHPPILTTLLLERGEEGALGRALHNVHLFWVLTRNDKRLQIHAEQNCPLANY